MKWKILLLFCISLPLYRSHTHSLHDIMGWADKSSVKNITYELIMEAQMKMRQVSGIRDHHSDMLAFDVGLVMGNIREKYRRMLEIYREFRDKQPTNRTLFYPPSYMRELVPIFYLQAMENVRIIERDIDKMIDVLEAIEDEDVNPDPRYTWRLSTNHTTLGPHDRKIIARMAEEQELKSRAREAHLMRRLGQPAKQHTTGKRFQRQWPVDENWEFGTYGDMGVYS